MKTIIKTSKINKIKQKHRKKRNLQPARTEKIMFHFTLFIFLSPRSARIRRKNFSCSKFIHHCKSHFCHDRKGNNLIAYCVQPLQWRSLYNTGQLPYPLSPAPETSGSTPSSAAITIARKTRFAVWKEAAAFCLCFHGILRMYWPGYC